MPMPLYPISIVHSSAKEGRVNSSSGQSWAGRGITQPRARCFAELCTYHSTCNFQFATHVSECGDVEGRRKLRRQLKCRSFDWYLSNVYPELQVPREDDLSFGQIHFFTQEGSIPRCLDGVASGREGVIGGNSCFQTYPQQQFRMSAEGLILQDDFCLELTEIKPGAQVLHQSVNSTQNRYVNLMRPSSKADKTLIPLMKSRASIF